MEVDVENLTENNIEDAQAELKHAEKVLKWSIAEDKKLARKFNETSPYRKWLRGQIDAWEEKVVVIQKPLEAYMTKQKRGY